MLPGPNLFPINSLPLKNCAKPTEPSRVQVHSRVKFIPSTAYDGTEGLVENAVVAVSGEKISRKQ